MEMCLKEHTAIRSICKSSRIQYYKVLHQYDGEIPVAYLWKIQTDPAELSNTSNQKETKAKGDKGANICTYVASTLLNNIISMLLR